MASQKRLDKDRAIKLAHEEPIAFNVIPAARARLIPNQECRIVQAIWPCFPKFSSALSRKPSSQTPRPA